jgi:asparagine synthase (glutamine-hydrolysing)
VRLNRLCPPILETRDRFLSKNPLICGLFFPSPQLYPSLVPGLVCVLGRDRAADLARAAARPMLRRPWQTFELAPTRDDVALGFAGEHGGIAHDPRTGVALALDGEIFGEAGAQTGAEAARDLLNRYLDACSGTELPQGAYAAAVWDPRTGSLVLLTDHHGRRNLWITEVDGALLCAGELKALLAAGLEPRLDLETWSQLFAYEGPLPGHCPLEGVSLLGGGRTLAFRGGRREEHIRWRYRLAPESEGVLEEWAEDFAGVLDAAVRRRLGDVGLALSGGYDSRCVGSILRVRAPETPALTYGQPGSNDLRLGTEVARLLGLPHRAAPFERGYLAHGAPETVWLSEGAIRAFHAHHLYLRPLRTEYDARAVLINYGGDHISRTVGGALQSGGEAVEGENFHRFRAQTISDELLEQIFTPEFAGQVRGLARTSLRRHLDEEEGTPIQKARHVAYNAQTRKIWPGAELFTDFLAPRDPYDDYDLVDRLRRMPDSFRVAGAIQQAYLRRFPELAAVRNAGDEIPPGLSGRRRKVEELRIRARRGIRRRVDARLGPRWWPVRSGLGDYATDLRGEDGAALLGVLLEPRTLARGQIREEAVRALVDDTLSGRARHTKPLGALLTFELFQRQFVDGDGFEGASPSADHMVAVS